MLDVPEAASIPARVASCKLDLGSKCIVDNCLPLVSLISKTFLGDEEEPPISVCTHRFKKTTKEATEIFY